MLDKREKDHSSSQIRKMIANIYSVYNKHAIKIEFDEETYDAQDRAETDDWLLAELKRLFILITAYLNMKSMDLLAGLFIDSYKEKLEDREFMLRTSLLPLGNNWDTLLRLKEFEDYLLSFPDFKNQITNRDDLETLRSILANTHLIMQRTALIADKEYTVYKSVKWFMELIWPKTKIEKLPEFQQEFKHYEPDLHIPELGVAIEYKLIREGDHPENHIDQVRTDANNFSGRSDYNIFFAVFYFINNQNFKQENIELCWQKKQFPENWFPIYVFGPPTHLKNEG